MNYKNMKKTYQKPFLEKVFVTPLNVMAASDLDGTPIKGGDGAASEDPDDVLSKKHDFNMWDE